MERHEINSYTSFDYCEVTKTLFLYREHLSLENIGKVRGNYGHHKIKFDDFKMYIKRAIEPFLNKGYKVVFEHKKQITLLIYNK